MWADRRRRATELSHRHGFAAELLTLYLALVDVWEAAPDPPSSVDILQWTVDCLVPGVVKATSEAGPSALAAAVQERVDAGGLHAPLSAWLRGEGLDPVARYLARTSLYAPLSEGDAGAACADDPAPRDDRHCPRCGGPPQVSVRDGSDDGLVSGGRRLVCARCGQTWSFSASTCPSCGETTGAQRTLYSERPAGPVVGRRGDDGLLPHLRVEACASCRRYIIDVDLGRDARAVAEVDELIALPLDLYAAEHGLTKITPNVMGF